MISHDQVFGIFQDYINNEPLTKRLFILDPFRRCCGCRMALWYRGIKPMIPRRSRSNPKIMGRHRWVVERTISWLHQYRRLRVRYERRADMHEAFMILGCIHICYKCLNRSYC